MTYSLNLHGRRIVIPTLFSLGLAIGGLCIPDSYVFAQTPSTASADAITAPASPLTLNAAFQAALKTPAATSAQQQLVQAQAKVAQARAQLRSQITLSSSVGASNGAVIQPPPAKESFGTWTNTISIPLSTGHKPRLAVEVAAAQYAAAGAQQDSAYLTLASQVSTAWFDLLRKQALLAVAKDSLATAERQQGEAEKRFRAGDVPELDVLRAKGPVATAQTGVDQAENAVEVARQMLNALMGRPLDTPLTLPDVPEPDAEKALTVTMEEARQKARTSFPDVRAAESSAQEARLSRRLAGLAREPGWALEFSDARSSDQTGFSRLNTAQATVTIPLSDGGLAKAQRKEADAVVAQAEAQAETARRTAEVNASGAFLNARSSLHQIANARMARDIAQLAYDKTALGYRSGLFPLTDVLNAQSALTQARIAYTQAVFDAATAVSALNNALGVLP